jgi:ammonium transporter Rh
MSTSTASTMMHKINKKSARSKVGIRFTNDDDGNLIVYKLASRGLAAANGLKEGDYVTEINGVSVTNEVGHVAAKMVREAEGELNIVTATSLTPEEEDAGLNFGTSFDLEIAHSTIKETSEEKVREEAVINHFPLSFILFVIQGFVALVLFSNFDYGDLDVFATSKYIIFRDIMVMLLLGFGYLMTFLEKYGLGAVGFTMLITVINMQCSLMLEAWLTPGASLTISLDSIINAEFSAAALLISFGALIGRTTPIEMCIIAVVECVFYTFNKVVIVFGFLKAEDVGGTITIHMFGAFFGLACAYALGPQKEASKDNNSASRVSDVFSLLGTTLLWVYWPSFVGATETGVSLNEMHCSTNTIMALLGSTCATFFLSQYLNNGKFDVVHVQNSTLAGGVAIGATARLALSPGIALLVGLGSGLVSVLGYVYSSPFLEKQFGIFDTCGVGNLHGYPSVFGGLASILLVFIDGHADFLNYSMGMQSIIQLLAVIATLTMAIVTGYITGSTFLGQSSNYATVIDYEDAVWWIDVDE